MELTHNRKRHRSPVQIASQEAKFHLQNFAFRLGKSTGRPVVTHPELTPKRSLVPGKLARGDRKKGEQNWRIK
ncbi:MAG: hypothetical protein WKF77_07845 [Planctomycetaceae bacterium]